MWLSGNTVWLIDVTNAREKIINAMFVNVFYNKQL